MKITIAKIMNMMFILKLIMKKTKLKERKNNLILLDQNKEIWIMTIIILIIIEINKLMGMEMEEKPKI